MAIRNGNGIDLAFGNSLSILFVRRWALAREPSFFRAFDLGDPSVVNDELHHAIAQALDLFANNGDPIGR